MNSEIYEYIEKLKEEYFEILKKIEQEEMILTMLTKNNMNTLSEHNIIGGLKDRKNELEKKIMCLNII